MRIPQGLVTHLRTSHDVAILTGAGISQESGLRTFRDKLDGIWGEYRPEDLATPEAFERNPQLVWEFYSMRRLKGMEVKPNPGHFALAEMEKHYQSFTLITQNVDGLHQKAGNRNAVELHGNITRVKCKNGCCVLQEWDDTAEIIPKCPNCGAYLRPDVVWFGEMLPAKELESAFLAAQKCEVFLSIGTSAQVQPAASIPLIAKKSGALLVEINAERTQITPCVDYFLMGKSGEILPELISQIWG
jgi:NAD-dependent deacetylase